MTIDKKNVLDLLYLNRAEILDKAHSENLKSFQLPETDVSERNLAAGASRAYEKAAMLIDNIIRAILDTPDHG